MLDPRLAIPDYTAAIKLVQKYRNSDSKLAEALYTRGLAYRKLREYPEAISDFTKSIQATQSYAKAYGARGTAYAFLRKFEEAKKDLLKAVELNPRLEPVVKKVSDHFKLNLKLD